MSRAEKYQEPDPTGNSVPKCKFIPNMPLEILTFIFENHQLNKRESIKKNAIRNISSIPFLIILAMVDNTNETKSFSKILAQPPDTSSWICEHPRFLLHSCC